MITHIVCFKLNLYSVENAQSIRDALLSMEGKIEQLLDLKAGVDVLRSERSYDVALITKFNSLEDLDIYQVHPVHQEVVKHIKSIGVTSVAVDYET